MAVDDGQPAGPRQRRVVERLVQQLDDLVYPRAADVELGRDGAWWAGPGAQCRADRSRVAACRPGRIGSPEVTSAAGSGPFRHGRGAATLGTTRGCQLTVLQLVQGYVHVGATGGQGGPAAADIDGGDAADPAGARGSPPADPPLPGRDGFGRLTGGTRDGREPLLQTRHGLVEARLRQRLPRQQLARRGDLRMDGGD